MNQATLKKLFRAGRLFEPAYAGIMRLREGLYRRNILRVRRVRVPVISIGNLLMGGTGKTPHVIAVCNFLQKQGVLPAVVTRGYGGKAGKGPLVVSDGTRVIADPASSGDEAFMMAQAMPGVPVVAGSNRYEATETAVERCGAQAIVLDDGFQHMALHRNRNVVLIPASHPFGNNHVFPGGELREPASALARATCLVITGCEQSGDAHVEFLRKRLYEMAPGIPVFLSRNVVKGIRMVCSPGAQEKTEALEPGTSSNTSVFAFCGIGSPESFFATIRNAGFRLCGTMTFRDHHNYSENDLDEISRQARDAGASAIITTAKDAVKISGTSCVGCLSHVKNSAGPPIHVLEIAAVPEQGFWHHIALGIDATTA